VLHNPPYLLLATVAGGEQAVLYNSGLSSGSRCGRWEKTDLFASWYGVAGGKKTPAALAYCQSVAGGEQAVQHSQHVTDDIFNGGVAGGE